MIARHFATVCIRRASTSAIPAGTPRIPRVASTYASGQRRVSQSRYLTSSPLRLASQTAADEKVEEITELYATARDEFEIAAEETEKMTVYAEDDRSAAREALENLQKAYKSIVESQDRQLADDVQRRVGQRIRELERAVEAMEEMAKNQD